MAEWEKGLRESMTTALVMPELTRAVMYGDPTPLTGAICKA